MKKYSWMIREQMGDQEIGDNVEKNSADGISLSVQRRWARDDEDEWPEAAEWLREQYERLRVVLTDPPSKGEDGATNAPARTQLG